MNEKLIELFDNDEQNQKLLKLYESKNYKEVVNEIIKINQKAKGKELALQLPCITENYKQMDKKIMVIGQELYGWSKIKDNPKDAMLATYEFQNEKEKNTLFWNFQFKFCQKMNPNIKFDRKRKTSYIAWTNIRKFSYQKVNRSAPRIPLYEEVQKLIDSKFNFLKEEIKIIKPDIVLFLTGKDYDDYIRAQLNNVKFHEIRNSDFDKNEFARVEHEVLPKNSFKIYHPNRFRFVKKGKYKKNLEELVKQCSL